MQKAYKLAENTADIKMISTDLGRQFYFERKYGKAITQLLGVVAEADSFYLAHVWLSLAYLEHKIDSTTFEHKAIEHIQKAYTMSDSSLQVLAALGFVWSRTGNITEAIKIASRLEALYHKQESYVDPVLIAWINFGLSNVDEAFKWLRRAAQKRSWWLAYINIFPFVPDTFKQDPRFEELLETMKLKSYYPTQFSNK